MTIKFQKYAVIKDGKRVRVWYSKGALLHHPEGTVTIYAREYGDHLPAELNPENDSDMQTDYFEKDRARITPDNPYYSQVVKFVKRGD